MKKYVILKWVILAIAIAINLFILINAFLNGEISAKESNDVAHTAADVINTVKPETITPQNFDKFAFDVRKVVGHFLLFALSGGFTTWTGYLFLKDTKLGYFVWELLLTFAFGFTLAIITEFAQIFVEGRTGAWLDVGIDSSGYFIGVFPVILVFLIRKSPIFLSPKNKKNEAK